MTIGTNNRPITPRPPRPQQAPLPRGPSPMKAQEPPIPAPAPLQLTGSCAARWTWLGFLRSGCEVVGELTPGPRGRLLCRSCYDRAVFVEGRRELREWRRRQKVRPPRRAGALEGSAAAVPAAWHEPPPPEPVPEGPEARRERVIAGITRDLEELASRDPEAMPKPFVVEIVSVDWGGTIDPHDAPGCFPPARIIK